MTLILAVAGARGGLLATDTRAMRAGSPLTDDHTKIATLDGAGFVAGGPSCWWHDRTVPMLRGVPVPEVEALAAAARQGAGGLLDQLAAIDADQAAKVRARQVSVWLGLHPERGARCAHWDWSGEHVTVYGPGQVVMAGPAGLGDLWEGLVDQFQRAMVPISDLPREAPQAEFADALLRAAARCAHKVHLLDESDSVGPFLEAALLLADPDDPGAYTAWRLPMIAQESLLHAASPAALLVPAAALPGRTIAEAAAALEADLGLIQAGRIQNVGNTAGIRVSTGYGLPVGWTNYMDLTATGSAYFIKTPNFSVDGDGNVVVSGSIREVLGASTAFGRVPAIAGMGSVTGTTATIYASATVKANTLKNVGDMLRIRAFWSANQAGGDDWRLSLGGTAILGVGSTVTGDNFVEIVVVLSSSKTSWRYYGFRLVGTAVNQSFAGTGTSDLSTDLTAKLERVASDGISRTGAGYFEVMAL